MSEREVARLSVRILEKEYFVACPYEERSDLLDSAEFLNTKMREIRDSGKIVGFDRIAVMAALQLAHELLGASGAAAPSGDVLRRIRKITDDIDAEIKRQESLF